MPCLPPFFLMAIQELVWTGHKNRIARARDGIEAGSKILALISVFDPAPWHDNGP